MFRLFKILSNKIKNYCWCFVKWILLVPTKQARENQNKKKKNRKETTHNNCRKQNKKLNIKAKHTSKGNSKYKIQNTKNKLN